ncbi:MAG: carbohydrate binding domain-containing protein [Cytophagales bacterium]
MKRVLRNFVCGLAIVVSTSAFSQSASDRVIDDFEKPGIWSWWKSPAYTVEQIEGALKVTINKAGDKSVDNGYNTFGRDHAADPLDFTKLNAIKVRYKLEGPEGTTLRLDLKDIDDNVTNANSVSRKITPSKEWQDVFFVFTADKFKQSWPTAGNVDPQEIKELLFFVNAGNFAKPFTGSLIIDEVTLMSADRVPASK